MNWESGSLLAMIRGAFGNGYKGAQSTLQVILVLGSASVAMVQGLAPVAWGRTQHRRTANEQVIQSLEQKGCGGLGCLKGVGNQHQFLFQN